LWSSENTDETCKPLLPVDYVEGVVPSLGLQLDRAECQGCVRSTAPPQQQASNNVATALLVAREWLRDAEHPSSDTHTCVVQIRRDDDLVGEYIVAPAAGALGRG
jgi:hypothetical protein